MKLPWKFYFLSVFCISSIVISCSGPATGLPLKGVVSFKAQLNSNNEWLPLLEQNSNNETWVQQLTRAGYIINGQLQVAKLDLEYLSAELPILQIAGMNIRYEVNNRGKPVITVIRGGASYLLPVPASTASDQFFAGISQVNPAEPALLFILKKIKEENGYSYLLQIYGV